MYWSLILMEENILEIKREIRELKNEPKYAPEASFESKKERPHMLDSYPNLLKEDPFYTTTLKKLVGEHFKPYGTRQQDMLGRPEHLHPFNGLRDISALWAQCLVSVSDSHFGKYELFSPAAAIKVEARPCKDVPKICEYWVHLREGMFWQPLKQQFFPSGFALSPHFLKKHPLTAHDFKFFFDAVMNPYVSEPKATALRTYFGDIVEFRVIDDVTFVVRWKAVPTEPDQVPKIKYAALSLTCQLQPLPRFCYQYFADGKKIIEDDSDPNTYRTNSVWAQNFSHHFAKNVIPSCGPWMFDGMNEEGISFKRNPAYYNPYAVLVEGLHYTFRQSAETIWQDCKGAKIDTCYLSPTQVPELKNFLKSPLYETQSAQGLKMHQLSFVDSAYFYIGWNEATPFFNSKQLRLAMTHGIDRNRIITQNLNGMGVAISGPFFRYSPSYDQNILPWPFNPDLAKQMLENEGWIDLDGDGIREKMIDGKKVIFRFTLTYYAKDPTTKAICDYIATALKEIGVQCTPNGVDVTDLSHTFEDKTFDAIAFGWSLGSPPEDPKQLWYSAGAKEKGSSNAIGFSNKEADSIIDALQYEYDLPKRRELYHRFHRIIHEEAPYTFLYSPKRQLLYREYIHNLFIPRERPDIVEDAEISEPDFRVIWMKPVGQ